MHRDVAEADHVAHGVRSALRNPAGRFEQGECVAAGLRDAETEFGDVVHRQIDGGLARSQEVEDDGVLGGEAFEPRWIVAVFLCDAFQAAPDDGRFVDGNIVVHRARTGCLSSLRRA